MICKMLIANRGEIAVRIIKACRFLNIVTVVVYSECDKDTLAVFLADEAICIGGNKPSESYLNASAILEAAKRTGCDSVHPGYGFLSEDYVFAKQVQENGLLFIGPSAETLRVTSNKFLMKKKAKSLSVPVIPSADKNDSYPLIAKLSYGGGGRGIRLITGRRELDSYLKSIVQALGHKLSSDELILERAIDNYKHIDIQFIADNFGKISIFPPRDCSIQLRYQKVIEETPATSISEELIDKLEQAAIRIIDGVSFVGVGTVEFLVDRELNYYFLEVNPRLQVEHTITEEATGIDLVEQQISLVMGNKNLLPKKVRASKCAIECRLSAKHAGQLNVFNLPMGKDVRIDTSIYQGYQVKPFYDPLIAKIIVSDKERVKAISKMKLALDETIILGVRTNIDELYETISSDDFATGKYSKFEKESKR